MATVVDGVPLAARRRAEQREQRLCDILERERRIGRGTEVAAERKKAEGRRSLTWVTTSRDAVASAMTDYTERQRGLIAGDKVGSFEPGLVVRDDGEITNESNC